MTFATIPHAFTAWCARTPQAPCIRFDGVWTSYAQLGDRAARAAGGLIDCGLQPGDRVALCLENSLDFLVAYLGTHLAGGTVVLVNTQYRQAELRHILGDAAARFCITDAARRAELAQVQPDLPALELVIQTGTPAAGLAFAALFDRGTPVTTLDRVDPAGVALIGYTSGTTGRAKGAMLLHRNLAANSAAVTAAWHWSAADCLLLTLPLFHIHGLGVGIDGAWYTGAAVDLYRRFDAAEVYAALYDEAITMFFGVPTMYIRLIDEARRHPDRPAPQMRLFVSGSAPLAPHTFAEFAALFGQPILERYGMTETVMNTTNPYDGERRPGTVGMPFPGQAARVVDVKTRQPLGPGEIGEIQVRGPHVCAGYWQRPDATAAAFDPDGWFNTGDLGLCSADGYFSITGRAHELIISGGYNIYPREIEELLLSHPAVAEVAVVGLPDAEMGEQVVAVIVPAPDQPPLSAEAVIDYCRTNLAGFKKPRQVLFRSALPRNAMGKLQKHILKQELTEGE